MNRSSALVTCVVIVLAVALTAATASAAPDAGEVQTAEKTLGHDGGGAVSPRLALERALAIFAPHVVSPRYRAAVADVDPREATLVLRDLVARKAELSRSDRRLAQALLSRPSDGASDSVLGGIAGYDGVPKSKRKRKCTTTFCIHWVTKGSERPSLSDRKPKNGRPDYVDKTIANMKTVWNAEIKKLGYKKPLSDSSSGGHKGGNPNGKIDIFIAQIGNAGVYGYCTTDMPRVNPRTKRKASAYCVIDNDFRRSEFPSGAARNDANKVTLAHEFFHAVQFAYDFFDQLAMMEGTATWIEDEVFTGINDNRQYFNSSPIGPLPFAPLDLFATSGDFALWQYGTWIWYRFLSEHLGAGSKDLPLVVRKIWEQAVGGSRNGFKAIAPALAGRGTTVLDEIRTFGEWNAATRAPGHYREANQGSGYRSAGPATLPGNPPTSSGVDVTWEMARRSNDYVLIHPDSSLDAGTTLVFSNVSIPTASGDVQAIVFRKNGTVDAAVDVANGASVPFDFASVSKVVFVLTNASGTTFVDPDFFSFSASVST